MSIIEFIGFIFSMFVLIFLMGQRANTERQQKRRQKGPYKKEIEKQQEEVKQLLRVLNMDMSDEEEEEVFDEEEKEIVTALPPPPPPKPKPVIVKRPPTRMRGEFRTALSDYETHTNIENRQLDIHITDEEIDFYKEPIISTDMTFDDVTAYNITEDEKSSRASKFLADLPNLKDMVIYHEILAKPKSLQRLDAYEFEISDS